MGAWLRDHFTLLVPLLLGAAALWLMMPRLPERRGFRLAGVIAGLAALVTAGLWLTQPTGETVRDGVFYLFAAVAIASAALMVTSRNPVYAALWFALATLSVCGIFLLRAAPFLAAATVIVYAGAIIVIFLFVIMLAQQHGLAVYDRRATQPLPAVLATFLLLGGILYTIQAWREQAVSPRRLEAIAAVRDELDANPLSRPAAGGEEFGTMRGLGRSLFGDYLFAVEVAGTLLLAGAIGAIAISPRRSQGTL